MKRMSGNTPEHVSRIREIFTKSAGAQSAAADCISADVAEAASLVTEALRNGRKVLLCGNGGSAADAQHIAAELAGRLRMDRKGLPAIALTVNPSVMTALSNDYGYDKVFSRQVEALAGEGDVVVGISTSGMSANVAAALEAAVGKGAVTIGLTGRSGGDMEAHCSCIVRVPADDTQRIQEVHIVIGHAICEIVETELFG